jgi:hypothetical protein
MYGKGFYSGVVAVAFIQGFPPSSRSLMKFHFFGLSSPVCVNFGKAKNVKVKGCYPASNRIILEFVSV